MPVKEKITRLGISLLTLVGLLSFLILIGCQDIEKTDAVSQLEQCRIYLDEGKWNKAIKACETAGGDEGYHLAAQAYMARGGLSILETILLLTDNTAGLASAVFSFIPDTTTDRTGFRTALNYLMGSKISEKNETIYIESILVSAILILEELEYIFGLEASGDTFATCDPFDASSSASCGFTLDVSTGAPHLLSLIHI